MNLHHPYYRFLLLLLIIMTYASISHAQTNYEDLQENLDSLANSEIPSLNNEVDVTIKEISLKAFLTTMGKTHGLNISVADDVDQKVSLNFSNERVANVLLFLAKEYSLKLEFIGGIISIKRTIPTAQPLKKNLPELSIDASNQRLTYDLKLDTLALFAKALTQETGTNIIVAPEVANMLVSGYGQGLSLEDALKSLSYANNLSVVQSSEGTYQITSQKLGEKEQNQLGSSQEISGKAKPAGLFFETKGIVGNEVLFDAYGVDVPIGGSIQSIADELGIKYVLFQMPEGKASFNLQSVSFSQLLSYLLTGTDYTYKTQEGVYLLGGREDEGFRLSELVRLDYRPVTEVSKLIPASMKQGVVIQEFLELNGLLLSGSEPNIAEIKDFIYQVDQVVPVVMIEIMIIDVKKNFNISTGVQAGLGDAPTETSGSVLPGVDVTIGSGSINDFLENIGLANLGGVAPEFYVGLQLLETNGNIDIHSTPRISTLNGHEATLNIGATEYYLQQKQQFIGTENVSTVIINEYIPVNADFRITITPYVSADEQVTLDVSVDQSAFTGKIAADAPPGKASRKFESMIRVQNEDMVILGGLEEVEKVETGSGLPFLARIPIIKWFVGNNTRSSDKSKLMLLIKPTVIY